MAGNIYKSSVPACSVVLTHKGLLVYPMILQDDRIQPKAKFLDSEDSIGPYLTLNPSQAALFWMPDVFIDQAKALRNPTFYTKPASLRVYNDSTIRYSSR